MRYNLHKRRSQDAAELLFARTVSRAGVLVLLALAHGWALLCIAAPEHGKPGCCAGSVCRCDHASAGSPAAPSCCSHPASKSAQPNLGCCCNEGERPATSTSAGWEVELPFELAPTLPRPCGPAELHAAPAPGKVPAPVRDHVPRSSALPLPVMQTA